MPERQYKRIWEIDFLRGTALVLMVCFHLIYDLRVFYDYNFNIYSGFYFYLGKISALLFITIAGVSSHLSRNNFKRGVKIFLWGLLVTAATYFYDQKMYIRFGILHFLGVSMILYQLFAPLNKYLLIALGSLIISGQFLIGIDMPHNYLVFLGFRRSDLAMYDYFPLIPYFGVFLYGVAAGKIIYTKKRSLFNFSYKEDLISFLGRHTLTVYLLHQPVLLGILYLFL